MRDLDTNPTEWVHDPRTGFECRVNAADVPQYQARGYIAGTIEDERSRANAAKMISDALRDKSAEDNTAPDDGDEDVKQTRAQARAAAKAAAKGN